MNVGRSGDEIPKVLINDVRPNESTDHRVSLLYIDCKQQSITLCNSVDDELTQAPRHTTSIDEARGDYLEYQ